MCVRVLRCAVVACLSEPCHNVSLGKSTAQDPLGRQQTLYAHRAARVDASGGYTHLRSQTEPAKWHISIRIRIIKSGEANSNRSYVDDLIGKYKVALLHYLNPSENRVEALWNTQALSTARRNCSAVILFSVMIHSV